jgi:hypothetical protein
MTASTSPPPLSPPQAPRNEGTGRQTHDGEPIIVIVLMIAAVLIERLKP